MNTAELSDAVNLSPGAGQATEPAPDIEGVDDGRNGRRRRLATILVFGLALAALVPTTGDFGLTWDEPAYTYSQNISAQWWEQVLAARSWPDVRALLDPDTLLFYWPYGRFGINFHPPLAGQLNLAAHAIFGSTMKDIPSRRMASVIEFALALTIGFHFLARRYGSVVGLVMAGSLLLMPRLYGQAHLIDTDIPGLLLWAATALAFWNGLYGERGRPWRMLVGVLLGLAFVEKLAAVTVILPLLLWLMIGHLPRSLGRSGGRAAWIDGAVTSGLMLLPLGLAFLEIQSLQRQLPIPAQTDLFVDRPQSDWPAAILALPLVVWFVRRLLARIFRSSHTWGVERPALETWTAILAFAPVVGWLGNPAWWRETLPRLTHYYTLSHDRQSALPNIQIIYFGQIYEFYLPWHNAWVLLGITVPVTILVAGVIGIIWGLGQIRRDRLPLYFLVHFLTLPALRMLPTTPAHDGVRLFLPTFFFLAAFAGWGTDALARWLARRLQQPIMVVAPALAVGVLAPAALSLVMIHPFELSYYNVLIGGPRGAWHRGFELTYWWDTFNGQTLDELNQRLPQGAEVDYPNVLTNPMTFQELQSLGKLRGDIVIGPDVKRGGRYDSMAYVWMQTQDSKASAFSRLLFAMRPWYAREPRQLGGLRVATVADPVAVSRAWALELLLDAPDAEPKKPPRINRLMVNRQTLDWARTDPGGFLAAAQAVAGKRGASGEKNAALLVDLMTFQPNREAVRTRRFWLDRLLKVRPEALVEAARILIDHPDAVVRVMTTYGYTDPETIGGYLDRDAPSAD
jgi:Dolichyl-phosphate-mannose-protein mannosyltransferase